MKSQGFEPGLAFHLDVLTTISILCQLSDLRCTACFLKCLCWPKKSSWYTPVGLLPYTHLAPCLSLLAARLFLDPSKPCHCGCRPGQWPQLCHPELCHEYMSLFPFKIPVQPGISSQAMLSDFGHHLITALSRAQCRRDSLVTHARLLEAVSDGNISGSVGLQIYELDSFKVTHASKYPAPVVSLGLSPNCCTLAVGMADGLLSIRKHARPKVVTGPGKDLPLPARPFVDLLFPACCSAVSMIARTGRIRHESAERRKGIRQGHLVREQDGMSGLILTQSDLDRQYPGKKQAVVALLDAACVSRATHSKTLLLNCNRGLHSLGGLSRI